MLNANIVTTLSNQANCDLAIQLWYALVTIASGISKRGYIGIGVNHLNGTKTRNT